MLSLSDKNPANVIKAFNFTSRYLDSLLSIDNLNLEQMVSQIYPIEFWYNEANLFDTETPLFELGLVHK